MGFIDTWFDLWRLVNLLVGVLSIVWSIGGYIKQHKTWNDKSMGLWYSRLMWTITGSVLSFEGIQRGSGWTYTLGFVTVASFSSFAALYRKGTWGYGPNPYLTEGDTHDDPAKLGSSRAGRGPEDQQGGDVPAGHPRLLRRPLRRRP